MAGHRAKRAYRNQHHFTYKDPHIDGCDPETVFTDAHYYMCKPHQNIMYRFTHFPTGTTWQAEAMHALQPLWRNLPDYQNLDMQWHMEELTHALLHADMVRAQHFAYPLHVKITRA